MKKIIISICFLLIALPSYAQKTVTLEAYAQTIPPGKKWVIPVNKSVLIAADPGALRSGSLCNARLLSASPAITGIIEGDNLYKPDKWYTINFTGVQSSGLNSQNILRITPVSFTAYHYGNHTEDILSGNLTFYAGQTVAANSCLVSIQAFEYSMTTSDLAERKREAKRLTDNEKKAEAEKENNAKAYKLKASETLRDNIASGVAVDYYKLTNTPELAPTDTSNLDAEIIKMLLPFEDDPKVIYSQNRDYPSFDLRIDTAGNIMQVVSSKINGEQIRNLMTKHFRLTEPGYVLMDGKKMKTSFNMNVTAIITRRIAITAQIVEVIKKEDKNFDINFRTDPAGTGMQYRSFPDSSYIPVMREYVSSQKKSAIKGYDQERLYAKRDQLSVKLIFANGKSTYIARQNNWTVTSYLTQ